jgi:recF protein
MSHKLVSLSLLHYRCYDQLSLDTDSRVLILTGPNGCGKTTVLDAIHYLSFTKSYFTGTDAHVVKTGKKGFRIQGLFTENEERHEVAIILREDFRKEVKVDNVPLKKISTHIGSFPVVMISPDDAYTLCGASEARRSWIDRLISQTDAQYLENLIRYNRLLRQRNALLKRWGDAYSAERETITMYGDMMEAPANYIFQRRCESISRLSAEIKNHYKLLSGMSDMVEISYSSPLQHKSLREWLKENLFMDIRLQRTSTGIHKDDVEFQINQLPAKHSSSQGQRKTLLFALKFSELNWILKHHTRAPILLLDDILEKLDPYRSQLLIEQIWQLPTQIFITDTHYHRMLDAMRPYLTDCKFIQLDQIIKQSNG